MTTGVVALAGVGLLFAAWVLDFVLPGSGIAIWAIVAAGVGCVVVGALWDLRRVRSALSSRRGVFGIGQSVILSLAIGTVVLANLVSTTVYHRFDFTGLKQFTLTAQTKEVLTELDTEVEVVSFFAEPNPNMEHAAEIAAINAFGFELLKEYRNYNDGLQVRREDPELRPDLARQYSVSPYGAAVGTVVFRSVSLGRCRCIDRYLREGGRLALLLNPNPQQELRDFARAWWLTVGDGTVVDTASHVVPNVDIPLVDRGRNAYGLLETYFPGVAAIVPAADVPEGVELAPICLYHCPELDRAFAPGCLGPGLRP